MIQGSSDRFGSLYNVYKGMKLPTGVRQPPLCGKGTAYKIKALYEASVLDPYLEQRRLGHISVVESRRDTKLINEVSPVGSTGDAHPAEGSEEQESPHPSGYDLASLLISTPEVTYKRGSPNRSLALCSYWWIVKVRLESTSAGVITLGDFTLEVSWGDRGHVFPHLVSDVHCSRAKYRRPRKPWVLSLRSHWKNPF